MARWRYIVDPAGKYGIYPEGGKFVAIVDSEEAARRIVRAVNAHDALVAAARGLAANITDDMLETLRPEWGNTNVACIKYWQEHARAALKLADVVTQPPRTPDVAP